MSDGSDAIPIRHELLRAVLPELHLQHRRGENALDGEGSRGAEANRACRLHAGGHAALSQRRGNIANLLPRRNIPNQRPQILPNKAGFEKKSLIWKQPLHPQNTPNSILCIVAEKLLSNYSPSFWVFCWLFEWLVLESQSIPLELSGRPLGRNVHGIHLQAALWVVHSASLSTNLFDHFHLVDLVRVRNEGDPRPNNARRQFAASDDLSGIHKFSSSPTPQYLRIFTFGYFFYDQCSSSIW